jgi:integrase
MGHVVSTPAGTYRANWRDPAGRQRSKTFKTKKAARSFLANVEADLSHGSYVDPASGRLLFADLAKRWEEARRVELTTAAATRSRLNARVLPKWGEWPVGKIDHLAVRDWVAALSRELAPATIAECFLVFSSVMRSAVQGRLIGFNPCDGIRLPARRRSADAEVTITRDELLGQLLPALPEHYRALVATAAGAGLRWGECMGLRWDAVDLGRRALSVVRVVVEVSGRVADKPYPKSAAGRRTVPLPNFLAEALALHRGLGLASNGQVFVGPQGGTLLRGHFRQRVWLPALAKSGLPPRLRFHDLRHCYATWLVSEGVPVNVVQAVLGHEQASTTLNLYTHTPADFHAQVRAVLDVPADFSLTFAPVPDPETRQRPADGAADLRFLVSG